MIDYTPTAVPSLSNCVMNAVVTTQRSCGQTTGSRSKRITLQLAKYRVKDEDSNLKKEDVIMCCLLRAIANRMGR
jgi:hypothetical protein